MQFGKLPDASISEATRQFRLELAPVDWLAFNELGHGCHTKFLSVLKGVLGGIIGLYRVYGVELPEYGCIVNTMGTSFQVPHNPDQGLVSSRIGSKPYPTSLTLTKSYSSGTLLPGDYPYARLTEAL